MEETRPIRVHLPVTDEGALRHDGRPLVDHELVLDAATPLAALAALPIGLGPMPRMANGLASDTLVSLNMPTDALLADAPVPLASAAAFCVALIRWGLLHFRGAICPPQRARAPGRDVVAARPEQPPLPRNGGKSHPMAAALALPFAPCAGSSR